MYFINNSQLSTMYTQHLFIQLKLVYTENRQIAYGSHDITQYHTIIIHNSGMPLFIKYQLSTIINISSPISINDPPCTIDLFVTSHCTLWNNGTYNNKSTSHIIKQYNIINLRLSISLSVYSLIFMSHSNKFFSYTMEAFIQSESGHPSGVKIPKAKQKNK